MNKKTLWIAIVVIVIVVIFGIAASQKRSDSAPQAAQTHLKIGVLLTLSGDDAVSGEKLQRGIELAKKDLAAQGVEFVIQDTGSKPASAVSAAQKMMDADHVNLFIGPYSPDEAIALSPVAAARSMNIFALSYCSSSFEPLSNVWCAYPTAPAQLDGLMPIFKARKVQTVALLDSNTDFGRDSDKTMKNKAAGNGYRVVFSDFAKSGERNFRTYVTKVAALKPDAVFMASDNPTDTLTFMKQLYEAGYRGTRVTFIDVDNKNLEGFGQTVEGTIAPGIAPTRFSTRFTDLYKQAYDSDPDYYSAMSWDVAHYVVAALNQNGWSLQKLGSTVASTTYPDPAIGGFKYQPDRTILYNLEVNIVKDGKYVPMQ